MRRHAFARGPASNARRDRPAARTPACRPPGPALSHPRRQTNRRTHPSAETAPAHEVPAADSSSQRAREGCRAFRLTGPARPGRAQLPRADRHSGPEGAEPQARSRAELHPGAGRLPPRPRHSPYRAGILVPRPPHAAQTGESRPLARVDSVHIPPPQSRRGPCGLSRRCAPLDRQPVDHGRQQPTPQARARSCRAQAAPSAHAGIRGQLRVDPGQCA